MNSYWISSKPTLKKNFSTLQEDLSCDVCIIGGGITGLSTAYYLSKSGLNVIVLEKEKLAYQTSGYTTAKITSQHGLFYRHLIDMYGLETAKQYLNANEQAISNISHIIKEETIDCDFEWQDSYVFTQKKKYVDSIKQEIEAMKQLDFSAEYVTSTPLPLPILAAIKFPNQAQFHPRKYMEGLINSITHYHGMLFENTKVIDVKKEQDSYITYTKANKVFSKYVVLATKYPIINAPGFYFMKMYQSMSYAVAGTTQKELFSGMYINAESPTISFRTIQDKDQRLLLIGGMDHKTGEKINLEDRFSSLTSVAKQGYPDFTPCYEWETEDCISVDKIPYIGPFSNMMPHMYVATGFKKWGMTSSNVAANIISDLILGNDNPYASTFLSTRFHPLQNTTEVKNMLKETTYSLFINKTVLSPDTIASIPKGDARMIELDNEKIGVYKDEKGSLYAIKPVCTHLGCELSFNNLSKTWDCPCHGSRFDYSGKCIYGPALKDLKQIDITLEEN